MSPGRLPPAVRRTAGLCLLLALAVGLGSGWGTPAWWALPLLAGAVAAAELAVVHLQFGRQRWTFSLTEAALGAALVCAGGAWTVVAVGCGVAVAQRLRRQPAVKLQYNVAQFAAATAVGQAGSGLLGDGMTGACAGLAAFWLVNFLLVALVVSLTSERSLRALVLSSAVVSALHTAGNSSIGLLAAHLVLTAPLGLLGLLVPLALLWTSYDQQARRSAEARLYAELARGSERATGRSTDVSAQVVLTAAARVFGGADVEMVMLAPEGPVRYAGDEDGLARRLRVDQDAFDEPWVLRALGAGRVAHGVDRGRPWCSAVLGEPGSPLAVLIARRPAGASGFGRVELRLVGVLTSQAETWLQVSDLSARQRVATAEIAAAGGARRALGDLGDLGAQTSPALAVLRDSAGRLAALADQAAGVDPIVEELHLVERAVAALLGAVALAAEPDLLGVPALAQTPSEVRDSDDWTTTGLVA